MLHYHMLPMVLLRLFCLCFLNEQMLNETRFWNKNTLDTVDEHCTNHIADDDLKPELGVTEIGCISWGGPINPGYGLHGPYSCFFGCACCWVLGYIVAFNCIGEYCESIPWNRTGSYVLSL